MSDESLAEKVSTETPWWAKAPVWLAAGIVGVPSMIAIGSGYFLASNVTSRLNGLEKYNVSELAEITEVKTVQAARWDIIARFLRADIEVQIRTCLHAAKNQKEQDECVEVGDGGKLLK